MGGVCGWMGQLQVQLLCTLFTVAWLGSVVDKHVTVSNLSAVDTTIYHCGPVGSDLLLYP